MKLTFSLQFGPKIIKESEVVVVNFVKFFNDLKEEKYKRSNNHANSESLVMILKYIIGKNQKKVQFRKPYTIQLPVIHN